MLVPPPRKAKTYHDTHHSFSWHEKEGEGTFAVEKHGNDGEQSTYPHLTDTTNNRPSASVVGVW